MRQKKRLIGLLMTGLLVSALGIGGAGAGPVAPVEPVTGTLTITLEAGDYTLHEGDDGQTRIQMAEDFGFFGAPGEPELPARAFLIGLPPGAQVTGVRFETPHAVELPGRYQIAPVGPAMFDQEDTDRATARWEANRERAYASDQTYPGQVGEYLGQGQWRRYSTARVAFQPFSYRPLSGMLRFHPTLVVTIEYRLPEPGSPARREFERLRDDHVLDDVVARHLVNSDLVQAWYDGLAAAPLVTANSLYDYVIVVEDETMAAALAPFKTWKESLGHTVNVVTLDWIHSNYSGVDVAEEVWNFLHEKYPAGEWGIRYVLLVGDLQIIPTRRVYYADKGWGFRSDHFFAKLSGGDTGEQVWNQDGDVRWGELHDDEMTVEPDVLVGRIPLNDATEVGTAIQAMITFEQDDGGWKHSALMAAGYATIHSATSKRDGAVLMEYIRNHLLDPNSWSYTRIFEQSGLGTSVYTPTADYDTNPANVVTAWNGTNHGLAILFDHGSPSGLSGHVWKQDGDGDGNTKNDKGEVVWSDLFRFTDVALLTTTHPSIVELLGCNTLMLVTPPWPIPDETMADPGGYTENTGGELLAHGAAAGVVGFSCPGSASSAGWSTPDHGNIYSIAYYFTENLIQNHYTLGRSLYEAKILYTNKFWNNNYQPFHWSFHLFGDPSMILEGYDDSAQDSNKTIHTGPVYAYGTDNDDNGDMYVAVSTQDLYTDGEIKVYQSTDHGETWNLWATVGHSTSILAVDVVVGRWKQDEFSDDRMHVFFTDTEGNVWDARIELANPANRDDVLIASEGASVNLPLISAARDPLAMPSDFNLYVTWEVDSGTSHQVRVARATASGGTSNWASFFTYAGYQQPHIDAGPSDHVYLTAVADSFPNDVHVKRSTDGGASWGGWTNLTSGDSANYHGAPVVAASTDGAFPTVWVAYNYYYQVVFGGSDLRFAYSTDGGSNWTRNRILSAEEGFDELMPDMVGHRAGPSRWMNIAYHHSQSTRTNVVWRWASGSTPNNWRAPRVVNDNDTHPAMGPQVIYSPGVAATGSGVVYPGDGSPVTNLYFAAPWLTPTASDLQKPGFLEDSETNDLLTQTGKNQDSSPEELPAWAFTGQVGEAFHVAGLARHPGGPLFAAATTREVNEANTGTVFRSDDGGENWEPVPALPLAWWLDSILITHEGTLLVGGMMYNPEEPETVPQGIIYRSTDMGEHWSVVAEIADTAIVHTLLQRANGEVVAGTGPGGVTLVSSDDGEHWEPLPTPPNAEHVYALLETSESALYAGGERTGGSGVVYRFTGEAWEETGALDSAASVYALLEGPGHVLYAGTAFADETGRVFRSFNGGESWEPSGPLGESQAVRALLEGAEGRIYAGLEGPPGWFTTDAYVSEDVGETWQDAGYLFMAGAVHDFLPMPDGAVYAASGDTYGVIFRAEGLGAGGYQVYLPLVLRNF
jgi:hypothetical protein